MTDETIIFISFALTVFVVVFDFFVGLISTNKKEQILKKDLKDNDDTSM